MYFHIRASRGNLPSRQPIPTTLHLEKRHSVKVGRKEFELWRGTCFLDSRNQTGKGDEFLCFSGVKVDLNRCDKKLSSDTCMLWKSNTIPSPPLFYRIPEEHVFKFILVMVALQRGLLENGGVKYFYHAVKSDHHLLSHHLLYLQATIFTPAFKQSLQLFLI